MFAELEVAAAFEANEVENSQFILSERNPIPSGGPEKIPSPEQNIGNRHLIPKRIIEPVLESILDQIECKIIEQSINQTLDLISKPEKMEYKEKKKKLSQRERKFKKLRKEAKLAATTASFEVIQGPNEFTLSEPNPIPSGELVKSSAPDQNIELTAERSPDFNPKKLPEPNYM